MPPSTRNSMGRVYHEVIRATLNLPDRLFFDLLPRQEQSWFASALRTKSHSLEFLCNEIHLQHQNHIRNARNNPLTRSPFRTPHKEEPTR